MSEIRLLQAIKKLRDKLLEVEKLAKIQPKNGADGKDGKDGKNGIDGKPGKDGKDGKPGKDGDNGLGIKDAYIDEYGHLIIVFDNDEEKGCGKVVGKDGKPGKDGLSVKPIHGIGIAEVKIVEGYLMVYLTDGKVINAGKVATEAGEIVETDPVFAKSPAGNITNEDINSWNNKVSDENYVHTDNNFTNELKNQITADQKRIDNNTEKIAKLDKNKADKTELEKITPKEYFVKINTDIILEETNMTYAEITKDIEENRPFVCKLDYGIQTFDMQLMRTSEYDGVGYYEFMGIVRNGINQYAYWFYIREDETTQIELVKVNSTKTSELENDSKFINEDYYIANAGDMKNYWANIQGMEIPNIVEGLNYLTTWILAHYTQKPDIIYDDPTGFEATNNGLDDTWALTNLDLSKYKRLKFYVKASGTTNDNYTPSHVVEMHLDERAKEYKDAYTAGHVSQNPTNRNRLHMVSFAVSGDKTKIQFIHATSLYGTAATNSSGGRTCYLIEGYYD